MGEALALVFAFVLICGSVWFVYLWDIKPDRDARRREAHYWVEQMHRRHWKKWNGQQ